MAPTADASAAEPLHIEDYSAPLRRCRSCGEEKPFTRDHFGRRTRRLPDGRVREESWYHDCKVCKTAALRAATARTAAQRKAGHAPPPPLAKALATLPLPQPARPDFRTVLQTKAQAKWPQIAGRMVDAAAQGDKVMIKLVAAYILGTPREATEDEGPMAFWHTLLAAAGERRAETDEDATDEAEADDAD